MFSLAYVRHVGPTSLQYGIPCDVGMGTIQKLCCGYRLHPHKDILYACTTLQSTQRLVVQQYKYFVIFLPTYIPGRMHIINRNHMACSRHGHYYTYLQSFFHAHTAPRAVELTTSSVSLSSLLQPQFSLGLCFNQIFMAIAMYTCTNDTSVNICKSLNWNSIHTE